jgi:hypothetical protein
MKHQRAEDFVTFRCNDVLRELLERQAEAEGLTTSAVARRAVIRDLQRMGLYPPPREVVRDAPAR